MLLFGGKHYLRNWKHDSTLFGRTHISRGYIIYNRKSKFEDTKDKEAVNRKRLYNIMAKRKKKIYNDKTMVDKTIHRTLTI